MRLILLALVICFLITGCAAMSKLSEPVPEVVQKYIDDRLPANDFPGNDVSWLEMLIVIAGGILTHEGRKLVRKKISAKT